MWHKITLVCEGPAASETAGIGPEQGENPFTYYRVNARFSHAASGKSYVVPGYFAADGDAADTGATAGNLWHVHFAPDETGTWSWSVSFREGDDIAVDVNPAAGSAVAGPDGAAGSFIVLPTDKSGRDLRGKGRLEYVGKHHLRFAGTGEYFMKCGTDSPENLLAYEDFDGTPDAGGRRKSWSDHQVDFDEAEAGPYTWSDPLAPESPVKGTELLGAIRYLSAQGLNAFSFLTFSLDGDDDNVFPHLINAAETFGTSGTNDRWNGDKVHHDRFDISKLAQWEQVFSYAAVRGMYLHFKTFENESCELMDDPSEGIGPERKLYYRELVARFSHHLALNWNLSEELINSQGQRKAFALWLHDNDPYRHPIVFHTGSTRHNLYNSMLGNASKLTGISLQPDDQVDFSSVFTDSKTWVDKSAAAGRPWVVACDEPGNSRNALRPDDDAGNSHRDARVNALWANPMAGGAGLEWYFGYDHAESDLTCEDFRSRSLFWPLCKHMLDFWASGGVPFWEMVNDDTLVTTLVGGERVQDVSAHCLMKPGDVYVVQLTAGGSTDLTLPAGDFGIHWYDPRGGGSLQGGSVPAVTGGGPVNLGTAPDSPADDWIVLVRRITTNQAPAFGGVKLATGFDTPASISVPKLLFVASDPDGDPVVLDSAGPRSAFGGSVTADGSSIMYIPLFGFSGPDTFPITVRDSHGATTTGLARVVVRPPPDGGGTGSNRVNLQPAGTSMILRFQAVPGATYVVQRSVDLESWDSIHTGMTNRTGTLEFPDLSPPASGAYYRVNLPAEP
ncbi:DUF5060 domain-containing protein [Luteolibacter marinus]|uniref:DUF5060 domain-containing protein n=1 Tax=Luteolibacter marinus TaxID=2776705 RepID=UPI001D030C56|nr:DUF5060 domain-containing protein [Luteolibacter marinus]